MQFIDYTSNISRNLFNYPLDMITLNKWQGLLLVTYQLKWAFIWDKRRVGKEVVFIWFIWHKAVGVNEFHAKVLVNYAQCSYCLPFTIETLKHRFLECIQAQQIWQWDLEVLFQLSGIWQHSFHEIN